MKIFQLSAETIDTLFSIGLITYNTSFSFSTGKVYFKSVDQGILESDRLISVEIIKWNSNKKDFTKDKNLI